ncbi:unnamed protein product, partial [Adineta ricciae]
NSATTTTTTTTTTTRTTTSSSSTTSATTTSTSSTQTTSSTSSTSSTSVTTTSTTSSTTTSRTTSTSQTTSTTSQTTSTQTTTVVTRPITTPDCASSGFGYGKLMQQFGPTPSTWTKSILSYTATNYTDPILLFGLETSSSNNHYLDSVSVVDTAAPSVELLTNPSFEDAISFLAGWSQWCANTCTTTINSNGDPAEKSPSIFCVSSTGSCVQVSCESTGLGIYFLGQSFTAIIGHSYTISFWQKHAGPGSNEFYVDVV